MTVALPALKHVPSPNYSSRNGARVRLVVVHMTEGSYAGAVGWFAQVRSQVSAHLVMRADGRDATQCVALDEKAWHVCNLNPVAIGIEGEGFTAKGYDENWARGMAAIVAWLLRRYGLPCRWAEGGAGEGYCSHHDLGAAGGGHFDPCAVGSADWARLSALIETAYAELGVGPLPEWALAGLPSAALVSPAPVTPIAASHGGHPGAEPGEIASPAPVGSLAWVQTALNRCGAAPPLAVDGLQGEHTESAVRQFQAREGLFIDGIAGPQTVAALVKAIA